MVPSEWESSDSPLQHMQSNERILVSEAFRHLEYAPVGIVLVHGADHTVMYANASFRQSSELQDDAIVGKPIAEALEQSGARAPRNSQHTPPGPELVALLDRVRGAQIQAQDINVSTNVSVQVSLSTSTSVSIGTETGAHGVWRCMVWPVLWREVPIDQLIVEFWHVHESDASFIRQRDIAERLLLSALREQELSSDNARLCVAANDARAVAVEAQLQAEQQQVRAEAAQHEAEVANSAKVQFLANMSHELRTPLNAIGGYAQLMEMGLRGAVTDEQLKDLGRIQRSQTHLLGLINAVLSYAKLEAGQIVYATQDVVLDDVVADAEALIMPQLHAKGLQYHRTLCNTSTDASGTRVKADVEKLRQILVNLLTNAVKFTAPDGQITVTCRTANETALVSVSDTGRGIPPDKLRSIFDPFVQVGRGLTSTDAGIGLGLAISRDLALGMSGDITVESVEGAGSAFTVVLPLAT